MTDLAQIRPLEAARAAYVKHAWREANDRFAEADAAGTLGPADLEAYAESVWWSGDPERSRGLRERAQALFAQQGDRRAAARVAARLVEDNAMRGAFTIAAAWLARADRLVEGDTESAEYGLVRLMHGFMLGDTGDPEGALAEADVALGIAERTGDPALRATALVLKGQALITKGQAQDGFRHIDEAVIAAVTGDLDLFTTGVVYCGTIGACRDLADYRRASEWTEAAMRWCEQQSVNGFPGICRVHRAEVLALRGALAKAEQEARLANDEVTRWQMRYVVGESLYEIGSIRLRMGDLPAAEEAFRQAHEAGRTPEPGMSLIRLAEGRAAGANASLRKVLAGERSLPGRVRLLPAQVEVALAAGDRDTARAAADELSELATSFQTVAVKASARAACGAVSLADGDAAGAEPELRDALALWREIDAPYESAQTRVVLARALSAQGDEDGARLELATARSTFERIGAARDARLVAAQLGEEGAGQASPARVRRTFLFTDIVGSTTLVSVIGDEAWRDLIRWHDDTLRAIIAEHGGAEIRHQGDGFVVSFDAPGEAIECAIVVQRRLADHRRAHGFAPVVRIGIHEAEATPRGLDYSGVGIHAAARVGAVAGDGEILVTRSTLAASGRPFTAGEPRTVELKGIPGPVEVVPVIWR